MILFDNLEDELYEKILRFLKNENFSIKGFRDIRKIPRKRLLRGLLQNTEMLTKTLLFIRDYYGINALMAEVMGDQEHSFDEMTQIYEKLEKDYPEKRNGFLANFLATPILPDMGQFLLNELADELTEEQIDSIEKDEVDYKAFYEEIYENMVDDMIETKKEEAVAEEQKENVSEQNIKYTEEQKEYQQKYKEELKRNKELSKRNKEQKIELRMLQEKFEKKDTLLQKSQMKEAQLLNQILELQQQLENEQKKRNTLEQQFGELKEVLERPKILYIGLQRDFRLCSRKYQVITRKEEEVEITSDALADYEEIWMVDNEVASLSLKMKLCSLAKQIEISVKTFYGEVQLMEFLRQQSE